MKPSHASIQLRALNARGLIIPRREKMMVIYRPEANAAVDFAGELLDGLRLCHGENMELKTVIHQATAFTHGRRIEIARALDGRELAPAGLLRATGMSTSSLGLHLGKLVSRGLARKTGNTYRLSRPRNRFGRLLLRIALS